jgi:hypothetical protein
MKLELNKQEQQVLIQLIDLAVKSGGLQVAKNGSYIADKILALREEPEKKDEPKIPKKEEKK